MSSEVGSGHISIFPVMSGFKKAVSRQMGAAGKDGAAKFGRGFRGVGTRTGRKLGAEMRSGFAGVDLGDAGLKKLQRDVASASGALSRARLKQADTAGALKVAEARLAEVQAKYPAGSSQVVAATERVATAQRRAQAATEAVEAATKRLKKAQANIPSSSAAAAKGLGSALVEMAKPVGARVSAFVEPVKSKLFGLASSAKSAFSRFGATLTTPLRAVGSRIGTLLEPLTSKFSGLSKLAGPLRTSIGGALSGIAGAASRAGSAVSGAIGGAFKSSAATAGVALAGIGAAISANLGGAIQRADMLNSFPKVMANIGFSSEEASAQIQRISDSLDGLPTSTEAVVSVAKGLAPLTGSLTSATDVSLALNDALLAGGASGELAGNAMEQYRQMLANGKVDMMGWRSMVMAMPGQMDMLAKSLLGPTANTSVLYDAMQNGEVSLRQFNDALVDLDHNGVNGLASFSEQARTSTQGIGTALANAGNRVKKAIATIIGAIGVDAIAGAINRFTSGFGSIGDRIAEVITSIKQGGLGDMSGLFGSLGPVLGLVAGSLGPLLSNIPMLGRAFSGLTGPVGLVMGLVAQMLISSPELRSAVTDLLSVVAGAVGQLMPVVTQILGVVGPLLTQLAGMLAPLIAQLAAALAPLISQLITGLAPIIMQLVSSLVPPLIQIFQAVIPVVSGLIAALAPLIAMIIGALIPVISALLPVVDSVFHGVADIVSAVMGILQSVIAAIMAAISGDWDAVWTHLGDAAKAVFTDLGPAIIGALQAIGGQMFEAGKAIVGNLIDGLMSMIGKVGEAAGALVDKIAGFLPHSPADEGPFSGSGWGGWGEAIGDEMSSGIVSRVDHVRRAALALSMAAAPVVGGVSVGGVTGGAGAAYAPTINNYGPDAAELAARTQSQIRHFGNHMIWRVGR